VLAARIDNLTNHAKQNYEKCLSKTSFLTRSSSPFTAYWAVEKTNISAKELNVIIIKIILAIILPPLAAALQVGLSTHFWINIILTILGYIPGLIHALWLVLTDKKA